MTLAIYKKAVKLMWMIRIMEPSDPETVPNIWTFNIDIDWKEEFLRMALIGLEKENNTYQSSFDRIQFLQIKYHSEFRIRQTVFIVSP